MAISAFDWPSATSAKTSRSRSVSSSHPGGGAATPGRRSKRSISRRVTRGASSASPPAHGRAEVSGGSVLEQKAARPGPQRGQHVLVEVEGRQHDHARRRVELHQPARGLDAVHAGHADVHQADVGRHTPRQPHGVLAVRRLPDDLKILLGLEDEAKSGAHEGLIVGDEHADRHQPGGSTGSRARTA